MDFQNMRRKDRMITDRDNIAELMKGCQIMRLGLYDQERGYPYVVPLNFGYEDHNDGIRVYAHCALSGYKLDLIKQHPKVCFEIDEPIEVATGDAPCDYTMKYRSIIGFGTAEVITDAAAKSHALDVIMKAHGVDAKGNYRESSISRVAIIQVDIIHFTAKTSE